MASNIVGHEQEMRDYHLTPVQWRRWNTLLRETPSSDLPQSLKDFIAQQSRRSGACADLIAVWIAQWVKAEEESSHA